MIHSIRTLAILLVMIVPLLLSGQNWTKIIGTSEDDDGRAVQVAPNGDIIMAGFVVADNGTEDVILQRYTSYGDLLQSVQIDHLDLAMHEDRAYNFYQRDNGNIITIGRINYNVGPDGGNNVYICEFDQFGNLLWDADPSQEALSYGGGILEDPDGNGYLYSGSFDGKLQISRIFFGDQDPVQVLEIPGAMEGIEMKLTPENDLVVGGTVLRDVAGEEVHDPFIIKYNTDLITEIDRWENTNDDEDRDIVKIIVLSDGSYAISGTLCRDVDAIPTCMAYVSKLSSDLVEQWIVVNDSTAGSTQTMGVALVEDYNGDIMLTGRQDGQVFLSRFDAVTGFQYWTQNYSIAGSNGIGCDIDKDQDGFLIAGNADNGSLGMQDAFLMRIGSDGEESTNRVGGFVWADFMNNCSADNLLIDDVVIEFFNEDYKLFARPDDNGRYEVTLPDGSFQVNVHSPSEAWVPSTCIQELLIVGDGSLNLEQNLYLTDAHECSDVSINITTASLLPCETSSYLLQYCNLGTVPSDNSTIELELDEQLTLVGSSLPFTVSDDVMLFDIGSLNPTDCGEIEIEVILDCVADPLRTYIVAATLQEAEYCIPGDASWDGSDLVVDAVCLGDSVYITIKNEGADMTDDLLYRIVEDNVLPLTFPILLEGGELVEITRPLTGATVRVEIDQAAGHPSDSAPSVTLEACVPDGQSNYSTGYVTDYPQDDNDLSVDIDCFEVSDQPQPFDEIAYPSGVGEEHFIAANQPIEYKLYVNANPETDYKRFEIRQELSPFLDMSTFRLDFLSDDNLVYKIVEDNVIAFIVEDNVLPLSAIIIKYTVSPFRDLEAGTVITNTTTLYENYDLPIERTTDRFLTIADPLFDDSGLEKSVLWDGFSVTTDNQNNYLTWSTNGEYNNDRFVLQHSVDGSEFVDFLTLPVDPQSSGKMRSATHSPGQGYHCYRIHQYDIYGEKTSTAEECVLIQASGNEITVQGANPFIDLLSLKVLTTGESTQAITVYQIDGKMVHQSAVDLESGYNDLELPLQNLNRGVYVVELTSLTETLFLKVMKE